MNYDFDKVLDRRNTSSDKWDYAERRFGRPDVLPMWVADMDFEAPPEVVQAVLKRASHGAYGYTEPPQGYYDAVVGWVQRRHGWSIHPEWIDTTPGVVPGLAMCVLAFTQPGDAVIVQPPVYGPFFRVVEQNGRRLLLNQLKLTSDHYEMDFPDLEAKLDMGAKMLILCSPANPVGRVWRKEELSRVAQMCSERGVIVVSDEIHSDVIFSGHTHIPFSSLDGEAAAGSVTFIAPSKTFNLPGLSTSISITPDPRLREKLRHTISALGLDAANLFGITALETAYSKCDIWLDQAVSYIEDNLRFMDHFLRTRMPQIKVMPAEGAYVIWLDCHGLGMSPDELFSFIVNEARVGLSDGRWFGRGGEGFLRINIACPRATLEEGLARIEAAWKRRNPGA